MESKKLNILLLTDGITPFVTGGMQKHSTIIAKLFAKNGHKVTLYHCGKMGQIDFSEDYESIFTENELKLITPKFIPFIDNSKLPGHYVKANKVYSNHIKANIGINLSQFDVIYAQGFTSYAFLNNNLNVPVIANLHGFEMFQKPANAKVKLEHKLLKPIVKKIVNQADYVLSFGGQITDILNTLKVDSAKIIEQSNGIEKNWITNNEITTQNKTTFTFIGRFERRKGIEELTEALNLVKNNLDFKFNFIGPIPEKYQIESTKISYFGEIKSADKIKTILDGSDFLISPSYSEGMPTVILEAMSRGNAVIATNVGANSKIINDKNWLIEPTTDSIKAIIEKAIIFPKSELLALKKQSLNVVKEKYIWENVIENKIQALTIIARDKK